MPAIKGYDGTELAEGCRVELHPGTDLWMRGARYGTITRLQNRSGSVAVRVDRVGTGGRVFLFAPDRLRRADA